MTEVTDGNGANHPADSIDLNPMENDPQESPILWLNRDCIHHLCKFLTPGEVVNFSETCIQFSEIVEDTFRSRKSLTVGTKQQLTWAQLRRILIKAGHYLRNIKFFDIKDPRTTLLLLSQTCANLTQLKLPHCAINDNDFLNLVLLNNLEYIDISYNYEVTGIYLEKFPKLVHLNIMACINIKSHYFGSICQNGLLKCLNIISVYLNDGCYSKDLQKLTHLEDLSFNAYICSVNAANKICQMKSLKALTILNVDSFEVSFLRQLAQHKSESLESLSLVSSYLCGESLQCIYKLKNLKNLSIDNGNLLSDPFIKGLSDLKQLRYLSLPYCYGITLQNVQKLIDQLNETVEIDIL